MNVAQQQNPAFVLERTLGMPPGGPKALVINLAFNTAATFTLDYTNMQQRAFFDMVQTLWVDNYDSSEVLTITIPSAQQRLVIPAGVQGYFSVICPNPIKITFESAGAVPCQVTLLNYPVNG